MTRLLKYFVASSLDGKIAAPDGSFDWFPMDEPYLRTLLSDYPDSLPTAVLQNFGVQPPVELWDTVIMGRNTYQVGTTVGVTSPYQHLDQYVVSSTLDPVEHPDVTIVGGDPSAFVRSLKEQPGGHIWLCGGGSLASALRSEIDELTVKLNPVTVGAGIPLFETVEGAPVVQWELIGQRRFDLGVVMLTYRKQV